MNTSVVLMYSCVEINEKLGCFLEIEYDLLESQWGGGLKCECFKKRVFLEYIRGIWMPYFKLLYITKCLTLQQILSRGKSGCKSAQNSCLGVFFLKRANL